MKIEYRVQNAAARLGISSLRKHQVRPIHAIINGKDGFVILPTSAGKSAIFQTAGLLADQYTLVVVPTLSLMYDQVQKLNKLGIAAEYISCTNKKRHKEIYGMLRKGEILFLYVTPERLQTSEFQEAAKDNPPSIVVVDEVHCLTEWGGPFFRPAYEKIGGWIRSLAVRPVVVAMTATAPLKDREHIIESLTMQKPAVFTASLAKSNIKIIVKNCDQKTFKQQLRMLRETIRKQGGCGSTVIYCSTKAETEGLCNHLNSHSDFRGKVVRCHSEMAPEKKEKSVLQFLRGEKRIIVATSAFAMGVDKPDIRLVLHWNLPFSVVDYYQQIGRAGRDGKTAHAVLFWRSKDVGMNESILNGRKRRKELSDQGHVRSEDLDHAVGQSIARFHRFTEILKGEDCIMQEVLSYLGEPDPKHCRHCTICQRNRRKTHD